MVAMKLPDNYYCRKDGYHKVYVLELKHGCFYVGVTKLPQVKKRFELHVRGVSSALWTRKHPPIKIIEVRDIGITNYLQATIYENRVTLQYINRFGLERVRGGIICSPNLATAAKFLERAQRRYLSTQPAQSDA